MNPKIEELRKRREYVSLHLIPRTEFNIAMSKVSKDGSPRLTREYQRGLEEATSELRDIDELLAAWESRPACCPACQTLLHNAKCPSPFCEADTAQ